MSFRWFVDRNKEACLTKRQTTSSGEACISGRLPSWMT